MKRLHPQFRARLGILSNPRVRRGFTSRSFSLGTHESAWSEITSWPDYQATELISLSGLAAECGLAGIWYKDESSRFGLCSFKALGGAYAVLRVLQAAVARTAGRVPASAKLRDGSLAHLTNRVTVTTATDGNHGRTVAWAARKFGCRALIYVPATCSSARESAIAAYGAEVIRTQSGYDETVHQCTRDGQRHGYTVVSDTSSSGYRKIPATVLQGYTVMVEEALRQFPSGQIPTHVFVQAGVGGLAAAAAAHLRVRLGDGSPVFIVVEPEHAACLFASCAAGTLTPAPPPVHTIMAGLDCGEPSSVAWEILNSAADIFMTIPDELAPACMRLLAKPPFVDTPVVAGESAVAGLAGLLAGLADPALRLDSGSRVLVFGTEGATDPALYRELVDSHHQETLHV